MFEEHNYLASCCLVCADGTELWYPRSALPGMWMNFYFNSVRGET